MSAFQLILASISTIFLTFGVYFFARTIFVFKKIDKYFYFSLTNFFGGFFVIGELILAYNLPDYQALAIHRLRMLALILCISSWFYCLFDMFLEKDLFLKIYSYIAIAITITVPTKYFLDFPIKHYHIEFLNIDFNYRFGTTKIFYSLYAFVMILFAIYTAYKILNSKNRRYNKIFALITLLPMFSGFNDFAVTHGYLHSIFISEYLTFIFVVSISLYFFREENEHHKQLERLNKSLISYNRRNENLKNFLSNILESMTSILITTDTIGHITQMNSAAEALIDLHKDEAAGKIVWEVAPEFKKYKEQFRTVVEKHRSLKFHREQLRYEKKYFDLHLFPLDGDSTNGIVLRADDISEIEQKESQLRQAQKMETVGTLAGGLAHDFNNALSGVIGTVTMLKFKLDKDKINKDNFKKSLEMIDESAYRASQMVQHLLSLSRKAELSFSPIDLKTTIKHVLKICRSTFDKSIEISSQLPKEEAIVRADATQLGQVILNLSVNASHAMTIMRPKEQKHGGKFKIMIDRIYADSNFCETHPEAEEKPYWVVYVKDTGVGMKPKTVAKIFDPFFTTKEKGTGTGLGLAMVYNIVKQHNGFIDIYSEYGVGTTFNLYFPVYITSAKISTEAENKVFNGTGTILVVDDDKVVRHVAENILEECGYTVISARDGEEGFRLFEENVAKIDLVLLDMAMPKLSGKQVYRKIKEISPATKILLTSGFKQDERVVELLNESNCAFIQKPFTIYKLSREIDKILREGKNS